MGSPETILERTDRMLNVLIRELPAGGLKTHSMVSLWNAGLMAAPLFRVGEHPQPAADREAQSLVEQHLARYQDRQPVAMAQLLDFQYSLQMRSKVISAIEKLTQD